MAWTTSGEISRSDWLFAGRDPAVMSVVNVETLGGFWS